MRHISTRTVDASGNINTIGQRYCTNTASTHQPPPHPVPPAHPRTQYRTNEDVYAAGSSFATGMNVDIPGSGLERRRSNPPDVTGSVETASVVDGGVCVCVCVCLVLIWHAPLVAGVYDIVIDANRNRVYDAHADGLDSGSPGFVVVADAPPTPPVPVPAIAPIGIIGLIGLLCIIGTFMIGRWFN